LVIMHVRRPRTEDADELAAAHVRAWQAAYAGLMPQDYLDALDVAERADAWRRSMARLRPDDRLLVAVVDERVVGFTSFGSARDTDSGDDGELHALNVHPDFWRAGIGSALLSAAHEGLTGLGHVSAVLWVVPGNLRARRFYERHGWTIDGPRRTDTVQGVSVPEVRYSRSMP
jgi:GNAT superfamily N-acetyltransferase